MSIATEVLTVLLAEHAQEAHTGWLQEHKHGAQQRILLKALSAVAEAEQAHAAVRASAWFAEGAAPLTLIDPEPSQEPAERAAEIAEWYRTNSMFPALTGPHIVDKP